MSLAQGILELTFDYFHAVGGPAVEIAPLTPSPTSPLAPPVPVIAAVHGCCYGAGIDIITACDIRYSTQDAVFSVKEVDVGLAADLGTLQR